MQEHLTWFVHCGYQRSDNNYDNRIDALLKLSSRYLVLQVGMKSTCRLSVGSTANTAFPSRNHGFFGQVYATGNWWAVMCFA